MIIFARMTQGDSQPAGSDNFAMSGSKSRLVIEDFSVKGFIVKKKTSVRAFHRMQV